MERAYLKLCHEKRRKKESGLEWVNIFVSVEVARSGSEACRTLKFYSIFIFSDERAHLNSTQKKIQI